jgi:hypothetical protein
MRWIVPPLLLSLTGCPALTAGDVDLLSDQDGDGVVSVAYGGDDCNDRAPTVFPDAPEICDEFDNDCDGAVNVEDDDAVGVDWFRDADHDGFADEDAHERTCADLGGLPDDPWLRAPVDGAWDCDDQDGDEFPGQVWRFDGDGDGFAGADEPTREQCERPGGFLVDVLETPDSGEIDPNEDCEPLLPTVSPGQRERCDNVDENCNGEIDEDPVGVAEYFPDEDRDGFGRTEDGETFCVPPAGDLWVGLDGDCNDIDDAIHPGAPTVPYNGTDEDCSESDEDFDLDGYPRGQDCDDTARWIHPGALDICDGIDNETCLPHTPEESLALETGAFYIGPRNPVGTSNRQLAVRGFSDLTVPLGQGDVVTLPGDGTVFLCRDTEWSGQVFGTAQQQLVVTSPQSRPASLATSLNFSDVLNLTGRDIEISNLELEGTLFVQASGGDVLLDGLSLTPASGWYLNVTVFGGDHVTVRDTTASQSSLSYGVGSISISPEGDLDWFGNQIEPRTTVFRPFVEDSGAATATFASDGGLQSTFGAYGIPGSLTVTGYSVVALTDVVFAEPPVMEANLTVVGGVVDGTDVTFGEGVDVRFGVNLRPYSYDPGPVSFDCAGTGQLACVAR